MFNKNFLGPGTCVGSIMECLAGLPGQVGLCRTPPTQRHTHTRTLALLSHTPEKSPVSLLVGLQRPILAKQKEAFLIRALLCVEVVVVIMVVNP